MSSFGRVASGRGNWEREVEREARLLQKEKRQADARARRHASAKLDRDVEKLLRGEGSVVRDDAKFKNFVMGDIVTDGAGLEWKLDEKTGWWWWLDEFGNWQGKGRSWTRLPRKGEGSLLEKDQVRRTDRRQIDASDVGSEPPSESAASSVSTAPTLTWPKSEKKVVVPTERPCAWDEPLTVVAAAPFPPPTPAPAPASTQPARADYPLVEESTKAEKQSLSDMVATIRCQLNLDDSLTMAEVIARANVQLGLPAEGNLARQASSLLREIVE